MAVTKCLYILQTAPWACTIYMYHCSSIKIKPSFTSTITVPNHCYNSNHPTHQEFRIGREPRHPAKRSERLMSPAGLEHPWPRARATPHESKLAAAQQFRATATSGGGGAMNELSFSLSAGNPGIHKHNERASCSENLIAHDGSARRDGDSRLPCPVPVPPPHPPPHVSGWPGTTHCFEWQVISPPAPFFWNCKRTSSKICQI
jgi:hypothetical protein